MNKPVLGCEYYILNVFTKERFGGNPLALVVGADHLSDAQMQSIASEFNLSETIYLQEPLNKNHTAKVRIFTPTQELPFAGHPTVGAAILLDEMGADLSKSENRVVSLEENVGLVDVEVNRVAGEPTFAKLKAPRLPTEINDVPSKETIAGALNISTQDIGYGLHQPSMFEAGNTPLFVPLKDRATLTKIHASPTLWTGLGNAGSFGIYAYCRGPADSDCFHARLFAPEAGVVEDPATGSAVVAFAGAVHKGLMLENGDYSWTVHQGEDMGRPSKLFLDVSIVNDAIVNVQVGGFAVRVARGILHI